MDPQQEISKEAHQKLPRATLAQKIQVLDWHNNSEKKCQQRTVDFFKKLGRFAVAKSTLNRWVLTEEQLRKEYKNLTLNNNKVYKTKPKFKNPEINKCLEMYYEQMVTENINLTERELINKWPEFYRLYYGVEGEQPSTKSNGWLHHFKKRNQIKKNLTVQFNSNQELFRVKAVNEEKARIQRILINYQPRQIYQIDEISFKCDPSIFTCNIPSMDLTINDPKDRVTVGLCGNAEGSNFLTPLIVSDVDFKFRIPEDSESEPPHLYFSKTGMLTSEIFYNYLKWLNYSIETSAMPEKIALLLDDLSPHILPQAEFPWIDFIYFAPSLSKHHYKPFDFGLLRIFKTEVKYLMLQTFLKRIVIDLNEQNPLVIDKKDLINIIITTYESFKYNNLLLQTCFQYSTLVPTMQPPHPSGNLMLRETNKEMQITNFLRVFSEKGLVDLSQTGGALDKKRPMDFIPIEAFLFPLDEVVKEEHLTEADIVVLVKRGFDKEEIITDTQPSTGSFLFEPAQPTQPSMQRSSSMSPHTDDTSLNLDLGLDHMADDEESKSVGKLILTQLKPFFTKHFDRGNFGKTAAHFNKFLNAYLQESNEMFMKSYADNKHESHKKRKMSFNDQPVPQPLMAQNRLPNFSNRVALSQEASNDLSSASSNIMMGIPPGFSGDYYQRSILDNQQLSSSVIDNQLINQFDQNGQLYGTQG